MHPEDQRPDLRPEQPICKAEIESVEQALTRLVRLAENRRRSAPSQSPSNRLDRAAYTLLTRLEECPAARLTELASVMEIDLSTASRQVRSLEERGFVSRIEDPRDQRTAWLEVTGAGREVLGAARALRVERISSRLSDWDERDVEELARLLSKLVASFTEQTEPSQVASPIPQSASGGVKR
jgi:DNA-binding MarR family transcriptional regulator